MLRSFNCGPYITDSPEKIQVNCQLSHSNNETISVGKLSVTRWLDTAKSETSPLHSLAFMYVCRSVSMYLFSINSFMEADS